VKKIKEKYREHYARTIKRVVEEILKRNGVLKAEKAQEADSRTAAPPIL